MKLDGPEAVRFAHDLPWHAVREVDGRAVCGLRTFPHLERGEWRRVEDRCVRCVRACPPEPLPLIEVLALPLED